MQSAFCATKSRTNFVAKREARATSIRPEDDRASLLADPGSYRIWTPEIAREMTRRWISEVPSKIV
jgi:hypothetical protein